MWTHRAQTFARVSADMRPMCTRGQCRTYQPKLYRKFKLWKKVLWWCKVLNVLMKIVAVSIILRDHCSDITLTFTDEIHVKDKTGPALSLFMHTSSYYFMVFLMTVPLWAIPNNTPHMLACFSQMCWSLLSYTEHNKSALNKSNLHLYYTYYHPNHSVQITPAENPETHLTRVRVLLPENGNNSSFRIFIFLYLSAFEFSTMPCSYRICNHFNG